MFATNMSPFQIPPAYTAYPRNNPGKTFFPKWWIRDWSFAVRGWYSTSEPKRDDWSLKWFSETSFVRSLPIRQEICDVSKMEKHSMESAQHFFIQTWLQQYCRRTFFHSAHCSFRNTVGLRSVWCRRTMIPGEIFTGLAKIPRNCQCTWLLVSTRAPGNFANFSGFLVKFCFCTDMLGSIGWLSPSPRLHIGDCFEIHNFYWELCDLLLSGHQKILHEVRLHHCVSCTGPLWVLVLWQISQFRSLGK